MNLTLENLKQELEAMKTQKATAEHTLLMASGAIQVLEHLIQKASEVKSDEVV